jgi:hypothetical protein
MYNRDGSEVIDIKTETTGKAGSSYVSDTPALIGLACAIAGLTLFLISLSKIGNLIHAKELKETEKELKEAENNWSEVNTKEYKISIKFSPVILSNYVIVTNTANKEVLWSGYKSSGTAIFTIVKPTMIECRGKTGEKEGGKGMPLIIRLINPQISTQYCFLRDKTNNSLLLEPTNA